MYNPSNIQPHESVEAEAAAIRAFTDELAVLRRKYQIVNMAIIAHATVAGGGEPKRSVLCFGMPMTWNVKAFEDGYEQALDGNAFTQQLADSQARLLDRLRGDLLGG